SGRPRRAARGSHRDARLDDPAGQAVSADPMGPELGWSAVSPFRDLASRTSFVSGDGNEHRLRVSYYIREADGALVGKAWFGPEAEGPPGCAHGGSIAAVLDEAMGAAAWMRGNPVVVRTLSVEFRSLLPL